MSEVSTVTPHEPGPVEVPREALKRPCQVCAEIIDRTAQRCNKCESWQDGKSCKLCGMWIPKAALRCGKCEAFQDWRGRLPANALMLSLIVSLVSVVGAVAPALLNILSLPSDTAVIFLDGSKIHDDVDPTKRSIVVRALNGGGSSSIAKRATLLLPKAEPVELEIGNPGDSQVPANGKTDLKLTADKVVPQKDATANEIYAALCTAEVTLQLHVDERNRRGKFKPRVPPVETTVPGPKLHEWLTDKIEVQSKECP